MISNKKLKIFIYFIRVVVLLLLWGYIGIKGQGWLVKLGINVSPKLYALIMPFGICIIFIFTTPKLFKALKENYKPPPVQSVDQAKAGFLKDNISIYRYRYTTVSIAFVVAALFIMLPCRVIVSIVDAPSVFAGASALELIIGFIVAFVLPIFPAIYAIRLLLYSVRIDKASVTIMIKGVSTKRFLLNEISTVELIRFRGGEYNFVKLLNGKKYSFDGLLKNSPELFHILKEHCPAQCASLEKSHPA